MLSTSPPHRKRGGQGLEVCVAIVFVVAILGDREARTNEARCVSLGSSCLCSEPLQDSSARSIPNGHDFADSPDETECQNYETSSQRVSTIPESGMPPGNQVDRVLEIAEDGASINWIRGDESVPAGTRSTSRDRRSPPWGV